MLVVLIFLSHREEMYLLGVLCLLSAALALPPSEQLHTNLEEPLPLKSDDESKSSEQVVVDPLPFPLDLPLEPVDAVPVETSNESNKPFEKSKEEKEEVKESKESAGLESKESKKDEKSEERKESEEKKKDTKSEESKVDEKSVENDKPTLVQVESPSPYRPSWFPFDFKWPFIHWPFGKQYRYFDGQQEQPIYIVKKSIVY